MENMGWWTVVNNKYPSKWEPQTFSNFFYLIDRQSIVVDFGTWIGPTILFAGQIASKVYGIEGDPAAFAEALVNLKLNYEKAWARNIHLQPACVSHENEKTVKTMKTSGVGNSCSSLAGKIMDCGSRAPNNKNGEIREWKVACYPLPYLLKKWGIELNKMRKIFIKIDVESYEYAN